MQQLQTKTPNNRDTNGPATGRGRKLVVSLLVLGVVGLLCGSTMAAFSGSTADTGNSIAAGTVAIGDNDSGSAMFALTGMTSSDPAVNKCVNVTYTGSLASTVRLYAAVSGSLAPYLQLTVTRGTDSSPSFSSCSNFTADATDYLGSGAGVIYSGLVSAYPTTYAGGIVDPKTATPETWTTNESHSYKFTITLNSGYNSQTSNVDFTWEARNQ